MDTAVSTCDSPALKTATAYPQDLRWSVMIPIYNPPIRLLRAALSSVVNQLPDLFDSQIEIIDDCSPDTTFTKVLDEFSGTGIKITRNKTNQGLVGNWNTCIAAARGKYIHILHQDDIALPGFYRQMWSLLENNPSAGAAFCQHEIIDENGEVRSISNRESETAGVLPNYIEKLAGDQTIQFPSIVVRRSAYQEVGAFNTAYPHAADWEMWGRIAARFDLAYCPEVLAQYRLHASNATARNQLSGLALDDTFKVLTRLTSQLPEPSRRQVRRKGRRRYAEHGIHLARNYLGTRQLQAARLNLGIVVRNCWQPPILYQASRVALNLLIKSIAGYPGPHAASS